MPMAGMTEELKILNGDAENDCYAAKQDLVIAVNILPFQG
jgi:hypothetical protein